MRRALLSSLIVLAIAVAGGCSDDEGDGASTTVDDAPSSTVASSTTVAPSTTSAPAPDGPFIEDRTFLGLEVATGSEVTVTNLDDEDHTFSFEDGTVNVSLGGLETGTFEAPAAGSYEIYCEIHGSMTATLVVS